MKQSIETVANWFIQLAHRWPRRWWATPLSVVHTIRFATSTSLAGSVSADLVRSSTSDAAYFEIRSRCSGWTYAWRSAIRSGCSGYSWSRVCFAPDAPCRPGGPGSSSWTCDPNSFLLGLLIIQFRKLRKFANWISNWISIGKFRNVWGTVETDELIFSKQQVNFGKLRRRKCTVKKTSEWVTGRRTFRENFEWFAQLTESIELRRRFARRF